MILHFFIALLVLFLTWVLISYIQAIKLKSNIPGPTIYPLILNDYVLWKYKLDRKSLLKDFIEKYGETFAIITHGSKQIFTINLANVQHSTSRQHNFNNFKRFVGMPQFLRRILGYGIFASDDEVWEIQRLHATPLFKKENIREMLPVFIKKSDRLMTFLSNGATSKQPVDIQQLFYEFTFEVFGEIGFGADFSAMGNNLVFLRDFDRIQILLIAFNNIITRIYHWNEMTSILKRINTFIYDIIQKRKQISNLSELPDLLSQFMSLRDSSGQPYPDKWIRDIVFNFMIAGRDTTASLMTWLCYLLSTHPHVLEKLMKELDTVKDTELTEPIVNNLKYLDHVVKETLRIKSPVPSVQRGVLVDETLPDGHKIKSGCRMRYWSYSFHRNPKYWDDPETFKPERWENQKETIRHSYQYVPFHTGPMTCLGKKMAELEAKTILILILRRFRLSVVPNRAYEDFLGVTTFVEGGCPMFVTELAQSV